MVHAAYSSKKYQLNDETMTAQVAQALAASVRTLSAEQAGLLIYLHGDLGARKTSFCRAFIQTYLPCQRVKSPTYTLMETYDTPSFPIYHFDLYRLCEPEELVYLGARELMVAPFVALIEWPEKAKGFLPNADMEIYLAVTGMGRTLQFVAHSVAALACVQLLESHLCLDCDASN
jgi:tRNA threonylcarbamoyladenosine biosynthesis protein TsaE